MGYGFAPVATVLSITGGSRGLQGEGARGHLQIQAEFSKAGNDTSPWDDFRHVNPKTAIGLLTDIATPPPNVRFGSKADMTL